MEAKNEPNGAKNSISSLLQILEKRNFVEAWELSKAGHVIECGKDKDRSERSDAINFTAYCLKTSKFIWNLQFSWINL